MSYTPGQGYKDGFNDRMSGLENKCANKFGFSKTAYDQEYITGYSDAERRVLENARKEVNEDRRYLAESHKHGAD
jgi:hypothetical protein